MPVYHLDDYYWLPGWEKRNREELGEIVRKITETSEWIIEGNYQVTVESRFANSDLIIWLDFLLDVCIDNIKKRHASGVYVGMPEFEHKNPNENLDDLINLAKGHAAKYEWTIPLIEKHKKKILKFETMAQVDDFVNSI